jgi:hypothetical protein
MTQDDGVSRDAQAIDRIQHLAHVGVQLAHGVADIARAGTTDILRVRQRREMELRHRVVKEERRASFGMSFHECHASLCRLAIDGPTRVHVERLDVSCRPANGPFPDERRTWLLESLCDRRLSLVARARDPVELIEALLRRFSPALCPITADMPLAETQACRRRLSESS